MAGLLQLDVLLDVIALLLLVVLVNLMRRERPATRGKIKQIKPKGGRKNMSVQVGSSGVFQVTWNGAMTPGQVTTWTASDPAIVLTPNGDQVTAAVPTGFTGTQFTLNASGVNSVGTQVNADPAVVDVTPAPPPPATGGTITQIS